MNTISNSELTLNISSHRAELHNIIKDNKEYLWQGDPKYWGRHSPVLFPICGRVWNNVYRNNGVEYSLEQHGFARDMEFEVLQKDETSIEYVLESNEETLKVYPFKFRLLISYILKGNRIIVRWKVQNIGDKDMYFQIGAHPGFLFPDLDTTISERGYFALFGKKDLVYNVPLEKGCVGENYQELITNKGLMEVDTKTFDCNTYIFEDNQLNKVTFLDRKHHPYVSVEFDSPVLALWSPTATLPDAPFFCIEPWYGESDHVDYNGEFKDKKYMQYLAPKHNFEVSYTIIIE